MRIPLASHLIHSSFIILQNFESSRVGFPFGGHTHHYLSRAILLSFNAHPLIRPPRNMKQLLKAVGAVVGAAHPEPLAMSHIESRLPNLAVGLSNKIGGDLLAWIRRCHGAVLAVSDDGAVSLTEHGVEKFLKSGGVEGGGGGGDGSTAEQRRVEDAGRSELAVQQRNAVFGELEREAQRRRENGELFAPSSSSSSAALAATNDGL